MNNGTTGGSSLDYGGGPQPKTYILEFHHVQTPVFLFSFYRMTPYELGQKGEELAIERLRAEGLQILETRWKSHSYELDIIGFDPVTSEMVFVEVKTRASGSWGRPEDSIDQRKIMRTVRAANHYLLLHNINQPSRFDVFAIVIPKEGNPHIDYYRDAFYAPLG